MQSNTDIENHYLQIKQSHWFSTRSLNICYLIHPILGIQSPDAVSKGCQNLLYGSSLQPFRCHLINLCGSIILLLEVLGLLFQNALTSILFPGVTN